MSGPMPAPAPAQAQAPARAQSPIIPSVRSTGRCSTNATTRSTSRAANRCTRTRAHKTDLLDRLPCGLQVHVPDERAIADVRARGPGEPARMAYRSRHSGSRSEQCRVSRPYRSRRGRARLDPRVGWHAWCLRHRAPQRRQRRGHVARRARWKVQPRCPLPDDGRRGDREDGVLGTPPDRGSTRGRGGIEGCAVSDDVRSPIADLARARRRRCRTAYRC